MCVCGENSTKVLRNWSSVFKNRCKPYRATVQALIKKIERTGSLADDEENGKDAREPSKFPAIFCSKILELQ